MARRQVRDMQNSDSVQILVWVLGVAGGLIMLLLTASGFLVVRLMERRDRREEELDRDIGRTKTQVSERTGNHAQAISELRADVSALRKESSKCDELDRNVAVLMDFKTRAEGKLEEVEEARRALTGLTEQIRSMPDAITSQVLASIPQAVLEVLQAARAVPDRRAANG